jgi:imidazolonepropionase-like amidohydrolase
MKELLMTAELRLLDGADLIDGSGGPVIRDSMIVLEGSCISYAGPQTDRFAGRQAQRWPLRGRTIVPGLIEAHTHAAFDADMRAYVKNGVTTIRFAGLDQGTVERLRKRIEAGELIGPRILSCGPMIDQPPPAYPEWSVAVETPAEAAATAERLIRDHDLEALILTQRVTAPVMRAVIEVAHAYGRPVVGQTWEVDGKEAAALGIDELHTSSRVCESVLYSRDRLLRYKSIADRLALTSRAWASIDWEATQSIMETMVKHGVTYCGMQVITQFQVGDGAAELEADADFKALFRDEERRAFLDFTQRLQGSWTQEDLDYARAANEQRLEWMRRFRELGGVLIAGTDMQFGGIMLHRELRNLEALGMSRLEVITAATGGCARALHMGTKVGTVREGLQADLVVLRSDPISDLGALRDIACVFKDGAIVWTDGSVR